MRLCLLGSYSCVPGGKLGIFKGQTISASISAEVRASSTLRPMGWVGGRVMPPFPFGLERYRSFVVGSNSCKQNVLGCQCRHEFSDSNSWTSSTYVAPEELRWPPCTYWRLDWIGLDLFNDDTRPSGHISRPTQVNVSQSCLLQNAPSASLSPALWMLSSCRKLMWDAEPYTIHPQSSLERTMVRYSISSESLSPPHSKCATTRMRWRASLH